MTDRLIRYSSTETFLQSPRKYYLQYILNLERAYENLGYRPAFSYDVGTIGHAALSAYYSGSSIEQAISDEIIKINIDPDCDEVALARAAIARYMMWQDQTNADRNWTVVANEERLYLDMGTILGDNVVLTCQPDLVIRDQFGAIHIVDHKFVVNYESLASFVMFNRQGMTYSLAVAATYGDPAISFILNQVQRKPPKTKAFTPVERMAQWQNPTMLEQHSGYLRRILEDIVRLHQNVEAGDTTRAYPHPTMMCANMCSFKDICCGVTAQDPATIADIINTNFRTKEVDL